MNPVIQEKIAQVKRWIETMKRQIQRAKEAGREGDLELLALNSAERILRDMKQADSSIRNAQELLTRLYVSQTPRADLTGEGLQAFVYEWDLYVDRSDAVDMIRRELGPSDRGAVPLCDEPKSERKSEPKQTDKPETDRKLN